MADRIALYDPELQLGAIVDTDQMRALGPIGGGPNAKAELTQFIERMPDAVFTLDSYALSTAWMQFWEANFAALYEAPEPPASAPVEQPASPSGNETAIAEHTASAVAGDPPPAAPHDTDTATGEGEAATVTDTVDPSTAPSTESTDGVEATADTSAPVVGSGPATTPSAAGQYEGPCFACDGKGFVPGATEGGTATCNLCHGSGRLPAAQPAV